MQTRQADANSADRSIVIAGPNGSQVINKHLDVYYRRFIKESSYLFTQNVDNLEIWRVLRGGTNACQHFASDKAAIGRIVEDNKAKAHEAIYIVRQRNTLSRLLVTQEGLQIVLDGHSVFTPFFDVLTAFGFKRDDDHRAWGGFCASRSNNSEGCSTFEICYVVRYVHKHNRSPGNPWSLRQTGVYHQVTPQNKKSMWILLQPSENFHGDLKDILSSRSVGEENLNETSHLLHLHILLSMASNWGEYLEYLWTEAATLDDKACHSIVGCEKRNDYPLNFTDCQKLQRLRRTLLRTRSILENCSAVSSSMESNYRKLNVRGITPDDKFLAGIEMHTTHIAMYQRNLNTLIEYLRGTGDLLSKILDSRNDKSILETSQAMQANLYLMGHIAKQGQKDSLTFKVLSLVATIYLPATLIATIFSSNLIQYQPNDNGDGGTYHVVSQFWLFVVATLCLAVVTFTSAVLLLRRGRLSCLGRDCARV